MSTVAKDILTPDAPPRRKERIPNAETQKAIADVEAGKVVRFDSWDDLVADLENDDTE